MVPLRTWTVLFVLYCRARVIFMISKFISYENFIDDKI